MDLILATMHGFVFVMAVYLLVQMPSLRSLAATLPPVLGRLVISQATAMHLLRTLNEEQRKMSDTMQTVISKMQADISVQTTVVGGMVTFVSTLQAKYTAAIQTAKDEGATQAMLADLQKLEALITHNSDTLKALTANTPASAEVIPPDPPPAPPAATLVPDPTLTPAPETAPLGAAS